MYHYAGNNPVRYTDPTGAYDFDNDEIQAGDTLTKITNQFNERYSTNYTVDEVASACGVENKDYIRTGDSLDFSKLIPEWHVTGRGDGGGVYAAAIPFMSNVSEIDKAWFTMSFTINETNETFTEKFTSANLRGAGAKLGFGAYAICDIQANGVFKGVKPTQDQIIQSFVGTSKVVGVSLLWFGITGSESENWVVNTGTLGISYGLPFSFGVEESTTRVL